MRSANEGINELARKLIRSSSFRTRPVPHRNAQTTFAEAFAMADEVLHSGVSGITDL